MFTKKIHTLRMYLTKFRPALFWLMSLWFAESLMRNGIRKFDTDGFWTPAFEEWGYPVWFRVLVGVLETVGAILLVIPKVRHYGGFILSIVMFGALITRIVYGTSLSDATYLLFMAIAFLYFATYHDKKRNISLPTGE